MRSPRIVIFALVSLLMTAVLVLPAHAQTLAEMIRERILVELKATVPGDIELQDVRYLQGGEPVGSSEEYRISNIVQNGYSGRNRVNYLITFRNHSDQSYSLMAEAVYDYAIDIFVTARPVPKGTTLAAEDYYRIKHRSSRLPAGAFTNSEELPGKVVRINLSEGVVLKRDHVLAAGHVKRGQKVRVEIENGSIVVTARGILRSGGTVGSMVRVYCETSKKELQGTLVTPDTVRVKT